jgi:peptide/nickel transport system substrate-binding protein/oligopeptide transport system substrate-binding protein
MNTPRTPIRARFYAWIAAIACLFLVAGTFGTLVARAQESTVIEAVDEPRNATPSGEQVLRLTGPSQGPESLDPAFSRDLSSAFLIRQLYRGLTRLDRDLNPVPELADRIEISADGLTYRFMLREDATFQNGRPIDADDVIFSLTRAVDPATSGGDLSQLGGPTFLSDIEGYDALLVGETDELSGLAAVDANTVEITLAAPRSTFLMKLASAPASIVDPDDVAKGGEWWRDPNGSGPFGIADWTPNELLVLTPYDEFFAGSPSLERVEIRLGANALQSFNLYQAGQVDVDTVSVNGIDRVRADESGLASELTVTPLFAVDYIAFRTDVAPLDDPLIRKALQLAFPRDKIAEVSYDGHLEAAEGMIPTGMLGQDWPVTWPELDIEAAKQAIADSSYGSPENVPPIQIYISGYAGAEALRDSLAISLGLTIEVIDVDWPDFIDGLSYQQFPAHELYWGADYPDPESLLWTLFGSGRPDNYVGYDNPQLNQLLAEAAAEQDPEARALLYSQAQQLLIDDAVILPLYYDVAYTLQKPYVRGLELTALGILRLDSVWLER